MEVNIWYVISIGIIVLAVVIVLVAVIGSMGKIMRSTTIMQSTAERLQTQLQGVQNESTTLKGKIDHLSEDFNRKATDVKTVVQATKSISDHVTHMNTNVKQTTSRITKKVNNDPQSKAYTEQMTNQIMGFADKIGARKK